MRTGMIILAGGVGVRMGKPIPKQFILLAGKPIIVHVLEKAEQLRDVESVVITCPREYVDETETLLRHRNLGPRFSCIEGGATRQESVYKGLKALAGFDRVVIHEAVRPFVTAEEYRDLIDSEHENALYGAPIPFTVVAGGDVVEETFERSRLVNVQLPQKFDYSKLLEAHERALADGKTDYTEDASMFFDYLGEPVRILKGSERNIKITDPVDLIVGEAIYNEYILGRAQQ